MTTYTIATTKALHDIKDTDNYEDYTQTLYLEQNKIVDFESDKNYVIKESENNRKITYSIINTNLNEYLYGVAIKDGIDVVSINDSYGIVAYYNNITTLVEFKEVSEDRFKELLVLEENTPYYHIEELNSELEKLF